MLLLIQSDLFLGPQKERRNDFRTDRGEISEVIRILKSTDFALNEAVSWN